MATYAELDFEWSLLCDDDNEIVTEKRKLMLNLHSIFDILLFFSTQKYLLFKLNYLSNNQLRKTIDIVLVPCTPSTKWVSLVFA